MPEERPPNAADKAQLDKDRGLVLWITGPFAGLGLMFLALFTCDGAEFGAGALLAAGAFSSGTLLGLLFGVPRIAQRAADAPDERGNLTNNNLVQVSDWLTKVLVGATLTQASNIPGALAAFGRAHGPAVGSASVAIFLLVHFLVTGFLSGYVLTRLILHPALARAVQDGDDAKEKRLLQPGAPNIEPPDAKAKLPSASVEGPSTPPEDGASKDEGGSP